MAYTYKKEDEEYDVLKEGDYECYIEKIVEGVSSTGSKYLRVQLKVRDDVEQEGKNRVVSDFIRWDDIAGQYNQKRINRILSTQDLKEGTRFETENDLIDFLTGCNLIAHIKVSEYNGKKNNNVYFYMPTKHPTDKISNNKIETGMIDDDDMPF